MQKILKSFRESKIIKNHTVIDFNSGRDFFYYKAKLELINDDFLYIKEYTSSKEHIYSYHWQNNEGKLIIRWDNSPHHKSLKTYSHHKHTPDVEESNETNMYDVLKYIERVIVK